MEPSLPCWVCGKPAPANRKCIICKNSVHHICLAEMDEESYSSSGVCIKCSPKTQFTGDALPEIDDGLTDAPVKRSFEFSSSLSSSQTSSPMQTPKRSQRQRISTLDTYFQAYDSSSSQPRCAPKSTELHALHQSKNEYIEPKASRPPLFVAAFQQTGEEASDWRCRVPVMEDTKHQVCVRKVGC
jgi:hypothetical protein